MSEPVWPDKRKELRILERGVNAMADMAVPDFIYKDEWEAVRAVARAFLEAPTADCPECEGDGIGNAWPDDAGTEPYPCEVCKGSGRVRLVAERNEE